MQQNTPIFDPNSKAPIPLETNLKKFTLNEAKLLITWLAQKNTNTRKSYTSDLNQFFSHYGFKPFREYTSTHIVVFFKNHPQMSQAAKARMRSSISSFYKFLIKERHLDVNPATSLDKITVPKRVHEFIWYPEEINQMVLKTEKKRDKFFLRFLYITAGRVSEICNVRLSHLKKYYNKEAKEYDHYVILVGKGNKTRPVWIPEDIYIEAMDYAVKGESLDIPLFRQKKITKTDL